MATYTSTGLIVAYAEHGPRVTDKELDDWYDNDHVLPRLSVPGTLSAIRYNAIDSQTPSWLALYDTTSPAVVHSPEYKAIGPNASRREKKIIADVEHIERRVYECVLSYVHPDTQPSSLPGPCVLAIHLKVNLAGEDEFNKWYNEEHMDLVSKVPGWLCGRLYKLVGSVSRGVTIEPEKTCVDYLSIHDVESDGFMDSLEWKNAVSTPWREAVMKEVSSRVYRVFRQHKVFKREPIKYYPVWEPGDS